MKTILIPIDFSPITERIIEEGKALAQAFGDSLCLLHVAPPDPDFVGYRPGPQTVRDVIAKGFHEEHAKLQALEKKLKTKGLTVSTLLIQGPTIEKILMEARRLQARLIVVGSHGHGALYDLLVGSVAEGVLRQAPCPVLVVPATK